MTSTRALPLTAALLAALVARGAEDFSVVLLPDTQKYSESWPDIYYSQTQWVADNVAAENIAFVAHLGDLVENGGYGPDGNAGEWQVADAAQSTLDGVVPWGVVIGNHDFDNWYDPHAGSQNFLTHFPAARFAHYPWWGGASPDGYNSFQYFEAGHRTFIVLHLMPDIPLPAMTWAQAILDAHPHTPAIIATHIYMKQNGRTRFPYMDLYDPTWGGHSGNEIFDMLVSPNPQVFAVVCGHIPTELYQVSQNALGQDVHEFLQDYQIREFGGQGFLRIMRFRPDANLIEVRTYSPWLDHFETDADSHFDIALDFFARLGPTHGDLNADNAVDLADLELLTDAITGPDQATLPPGVDPLVFERADVDFDGDVDLADTSRAQRAVTG